LLYGHRLIFRIALGAVLIFGITFLYPIDKVYLPIDIPQNGEVATKDLIAPFDFPIMKTNDEMDRDRELVLRNLRPVVKFDTILTSAVNERINRFFSYADSLLKMNIEPDTLAERLHLKYDFFAESLLVQLSDPASFEKIKKFCFDVMDTVLSSGLITDIDNLPFIESGLITMMAGADIKTVPRDRIFNFAKVKNYLGLQSGLRFDTLQKERQIAVSITNHFLEPNLKILTEKQLRSIRTPNLRLLLLIRGGFIRAKKS